MPLRGECSHASPWPNNVSRFARDQRLGNWTVIVAIERLSPIVAFNPDMSIRNNLSCKMALCRIDSVASRSYHSFEAKALGIVRCPECYNVAPSHILSSIVLPDGNVIAASCLIEVGGQRGRHRVAVDRVDLNERVVDEDCRGNGP